MTKFYDTCALLELQEDAFNNFFMISSFTLIELEEIKNSSSKDEDIKWKARKLLHLLKENREDFFVSVLSNEQLKEYIDTLKIPNNTDGKIISSFVYEYSLIKEMNFVTCDLSCYMIAKNHLNLPCEFLEKKPEPEYTGYKEILMSEEEMADFYERILVENRNPYYLKTNEYLIIKTREENLFTNHAEGIIVDKYKWSGNKYLNIPYYTINSDFFGVVTQKDEYQQLALDALTSNQITMLRGPAGTGKTLLAFAYMFHLLEQDMIDKIIIFCNTVATKGSAKLGFYPGSRTEKLLDSQIGNMLKSKLGSKLVIEKLIDEEKLILLPMSDIRGFDTTGMNAAIYISEAQNLDIELMKLALQRIGNDCICIIDGDYNTQTDLAMYSGSRNGMRRVSEVFRGQDIYGEVALKNIYRSKIAALAQKL